MKPQKKANQNHVSQRDDPFDMMFGFGSQSPRKTTPTNQTTQSGFLNQMMAEFKTSEGNWDMDKLLSTGEKTRKLAGQFQQVGSSVFSLFKNK